MIFWSPRPLCPQEGASLASQRKYFSGLGAGWNGQLRRSIHRGNFNIRAKHRLGDVHVQIKQNVRPLAAEELVLFDLDIHVQVAGRAAVHSRLTFSC